MSDDARATTDNSEDKQPGEADRSGLEYWRGLAEIAREENLDEVEVEQEGVRVTLRAASTAVSAASFVPAIGTPAPVHAQPTAQSTPQPHQENLAEVVSPMVGVFYRAPSPNDPNFVEVGDKVEVGQTVALVEAMKVFNEITSEAAGIVAEIKVNNNDLVETGQVLLTIRKA